MDPISQALMMGAAGNTSGAPPAPLSAPLLFIASIDSSGTNYLHGLTTSGTKVGTFASPVAFSGPSGFFRNPYLYLFSGITSNALYKIDCNTMGLVKTVNAPSGVGRMGGISPISATKLISVSGADQSYYIFDTDTDTFSTVSYPNSFTAVASSHGTLTFYDETSSGLSNIQSRVWWTAGTTSPTSDVKLQYADWNGSTLGALTTLSGGTNQSRNTAVPMSSSKGLVFNTNFKFRLNQSSFTQILPTDYSFGGATYGFMTVDPFRYIAVSGANSTYYYGMYQDSSPGTAGYGFRVAAIDPFGSTTPAATDLGISLVSNGLYYAPQQGGFCARINDSGYVAIAYYDAITYGLATDRVRIRIYNGVTNVANYTVNVGSSYTSGNGNGSTTQIGFFPHFWSTDLLYSGSTYA